MLGFANEGGWAISEEGAKVYIKACDEFLDRADEMIGKAEQRQRRGRGRRPAHGGNWYRLMKRPDWHSTLVAAMGMLLLAGGRSDTSAGTPNTATSVAPSTASHGDRGPSSTPRIGGIRSRTWSPATCSTQRSTS